MPEQKSRNFYLNHLNINSRVFIAYLIDILFYISIAAAFLVFSSMLKNVLTGLNSLDYANILTSDPNIANSNLSILKLVFAKMLGTILSFIIFSIISFTLFKGIIWAKLTGVKFNGRYYLKTLLMNLLFGIIFISLFSYFTLNLKNTTLAFIMIPIFMHFNALSYYFILKKTNGKVFKAIGKAIKFTLNIKKYALPYLLIIMVFYSLTAISQIIFSRIFPIQYYTLMVFVFVLVYLSILRNYFANVINDIEK